MDHTITERAIDRAVEIWKRALTDPKYKVTGDDPKDIAGLMYQAQTDSMTKHLTNNATPEMLEKFGVELKKRLMDPDIHDATKRWLDVDYHPSQLLKESAEAVGLKIEFPYKSSVGLLGDYVRDSFGYGTSDRYHYPLENGKWLVTRLIGSDIEKIVQHYNDGGVIPGIEVEE